MAALNGDDLRRLAALGAQRRLDEIRREETAIRQAFPELFRARGVRGVEVRTPAAAPAARKAGRRGRKRMSSAERKAVSERMKKYWAERRKAKDKE